MFIGVLKGNLLNGVQVAAGSNPVAPTTQNLQKVPQNTTKSGFSSGNPLFLLG